MSFPLYLAIGFLFGVGFGFFAQRARFCVARGLVEVFSGKKMRFMRLLLVVLTITGAGFLISGWVNPDLGLKTIGQIRGAGFYNILSGILFGMGILITGGCSLGTLCRLGEGNLNYLVALLSFIPGMALVVYVLNPLLEEGYNTQRILLPDLLGIPDVWLTGILVSFAVLSTSLAFIWRQRSARAGGEDTIEPTSAEESPDKSATAEEKVESEGELSPESAAASVDQIMKETEPAAKENQGGPEKETEVSSESAIASVNKIMKATEPAAAKAEEKPAVAEDEPAKESVVAETIEEPVTAEDEPLEEPAVAETTNEPVTAEDEPLEEPAVAETTNEPATAEDEPVEEPVVAETTEEPVTAEDEPVEEPVVAETTDEPVTAEDEPVEEPAVAETTDEPVTAKDEPAEEPAVAKTTEESALDEDEAIAAAFAARARREPTVAETSEEPAVDEDEAIEARAEAVDG